MNERDVAAIGDRFLSEIENQMIMKSRYSDAEKIIMLSGGIDSLVLLCAAMKIWGRDRVRCVTMVGQDTYDSKHASATAKWFGVQQDVIRLSFNDMMPIILKDIRGTKIDNLFAAFLYASLKITFSRVNISQRDVFLGEGADSLYGSTGPFAYIESKDMAERLGVSIDEARTMCKRKYQNKMRKLRKNKFDADAIMRKLVSDAGGNAVLPFLETRHVEVEDLPYSVVDPNGKSFVKNAAKSRYRISDKVIKRKRVAFQCGTGLYEMMKGELVKMFPTVGKSANKIIEWLGGTSVNESIVNDMVKTYA